MLGALLLATAGLTLFAAQAPETAKREKKYVPYKITRGDVISVTVLDEPNLTAPQRRVEATGTVNLVYIQDIRVVGLTINEAQAAIARAYRDGRFLRNPVVSVSVETYAPRPVIVSGKVNVPGRQLIEPDTEVTIVDVISKAGGFTETARGTAVRVTRTMPDGSLKVFTLDVESALKGRAPPNSGDAAFVIEPDDIIYVPERFI